MRDDDFFVCEGAANQKSFYTRIESESTVNSSDKFSLLTMPEYYVILCMTLRGAS